MPKLSLEIDYAHEESGWIPCWLIVDGQRHGFEASGVFPPFWDLLNFIKDVAIQRLPSGAGWEEEGPDVTFVAKPLAEDHPLVHLTVQYSEEDEPWLDADLPREEVVQAFLPPILDFATHFPQAEADWYISKERVESVKAFIEQGVPLRSDEEHPRRLEIAVTDDGSEYIHGHVSLGLRLFGDQLASILLHDAHPFWKSWFEFVEKVAHGDLPAHCEYQAPEGSDNTNSLFAAHPLQNSQLFRFVVHEQWKQGTPSVVIDEVLIREQFVQDFARAFREFLPYFVKKPDGEGLTFDLATLPIENLDGGPAGSLVEKVEPMPNKEWVFEDSTQQLTITIPALMPQKITGRPAKQKVHITAARHYGPMIRFGGIEVNEEVKLTLTPQQARELARWLLDATEGLE